MTTASARHGPTTVVDVDYEVVTIDSGLQCAGASQPAAVGDLLCTCGYLMVPCDIARRLTTPTDSQPLRGDQ